MAETPEESPHRRALKARWVFPVAVGPLPDAAVTLQSGRIAALGKPAPGVPLQDLGNVAILPGLVNAHTHLEFSDLAAPLGRRGMNLVDWIREVMDRRCQTGGDSSGAIRRGVEESLRCGTTTVGEIAQPDWQLEPFDAAGIRAVIFLELIAPTRDRTDRALLLAQRHLASAEVTRAFRAGLGLHAPYSVHGDLLRRSIELSRQTGAPISFHLAESRDELEFLRSRGGRFAALLADLRIPAMPLCDQPFGPVDYLRELSRARRVLAIHGNYLRDEEAALLARSAAHMSVVYCPRTHAYFIDEPYPLERYLSAGVLVALGTDSRASAPDLSILEEMRFVAKRHPSVPPGIVLRTGTLNGARALGLEAEVGSLEPGKWADLAVVALPDRDAADPHALLFDSEERAVATWLQGKGWRVTGDG